MYDIFILSSVTYSMKAKELLTSRGIYCRIEKVKPEYATKGCSYGAVVKRKDTENAKQILRSQGVKIYNIISYDSIS